MAATGLLDIVSKVVIAKQPATGVGGGAIQMGELLRSRQGGGYGFGVGAGRWNKAYYYNSRHSGNAALLTTSARALDLQTQVDEFNVALGLEEVCYFEFISDPDNAQVITMTPNASNGWTGMIAAAGDLLNIKPGQRFVADLMRLDIGYLVSATSKVLDIANAVSSTQHYEMLIVGRNTA